MKHNFITYVLLKKNNREGPGGVMCPEAKRSCFHTKVVKYLLYIYVWGVNNSPVSMFHVSFLHLLQNIRTQMFSEQFIEKTNRILGYCMFATVTQTVSCVFIGL